jgi:hypothetical protein
MAKLAPLTPKFAKQSCIKIFHNECTKSSPLDPILMFWGVPDRFIGAPKVDAKLAELAPLTLKFAKRSCVKIFRNERTSSKPLDPKPMFWGISDRFVTARKSVQNWPNTCH